MVFDISDHYVHLFVGSIVVIISSIYHYFNIVRPPILCCTRSKFKLFLEQSMPILSEAYWRTFWCVDGRLQTAMQLFYRVDFHLPYDREIFELDDGGQVALDWVHTKEENPDAPIILLLPGITGHSGEAYMKKLASSAHECGFRCLVFNYRGRGDIELKTPKLYSLNDTTDSLQVVRHIKKRFPNAVLGACGTSMGAVILAHFLIKHPDQKEVAFALLNYTFFDVFDASGKMSEGIINTCINHVLAYSLRQTVARYRHVLDTKEAPWNVSEILKTRRIQEFDEKLTIKMFGYETVHDYYKESDLVDKMDKIRIPVLCLNTADDPGQPLEYLEENSKLFFDNDKVVVIITARGGHMSHLEGVWPMREKSNFMNRIFVQYFTAMFHDESYKLFVPQDAKNDCLISNLARNENKARA